MLCVFRWAISSCKSLSKRSISYSSFRVHATRWVEKDSRFMSLSSAGACRGQSPVLRPLPVRGFGNTLPVAFLAEDLFQHGDLPVLVQSAFAKRYDLSRSLLFGLLFMKSFD